MECVHARGEIDLAAFGSLKTHIIDQRLQSGRALLLTHEVLNRGEDEALILAKGCKPIQADKIKWHGGPALRYLRRPPSKIAPVPLASPRRQ